MYVRIAVLLTAFSALSAQNVPVLFECTEDDAQTAGLHCSEEEPCPVFLELSAVEAVGNRLFLTGNLHSSAATLYSVLMTSSDAGKTWTEGYKRLRAAALDQIQFFDFETGWISGNYLSGTPRDPFFLVTGDGGTTWTALPGVTGGMTLQQTFVPGQNGDAASWTVGAWVWWSGHQSPKFYSL